MARTNSVAFAPHPPPHLFSIRSHSQHSDPTGVVHRRVVPDTPAVGRLPGLAGFDSPRVSYMDAAFLDAWEEVADEDADLSVGDVVHAAETVAEASNQYEDGYRAGRVDGALAVAELLLNDE